MTEGIAVIIRFSGDADDVLDRFERGPDRVERFPIRELGWG